MIENWQGSLQGYIKEWFKWLTMSNGELFGKTKQYKFILIYVGLWFSVEATIKN